MLFHFGLQETGFLQLPRIHVELLRIVKMKGEM
jgi:hypothetical protein